MSRFFLASDLHLEFHDNPFRQWKEDYSNDVLLLAGDTAEFKNYHHYERFFIDISSHFKQVFIIAGNHEFYFSDYNSVLEDMEKFFARFPNVHFLNNTALKVEGEEVYIFGGTFWTEFKNDFTAIETARRRMNDYRLISYYDMPLIPEDTISFHKEAIKKLKTFLSKHKNYNVIVMSHHAPTFHSVGKDFAGDDLNAAYASDLSEIILNNPQISNWVHGHLHDDKEYEVGNCTVTCHPRGYYNVADSDFQKYSFKLLEV